MSIWDKTNDAKYSKKEKKGSKRGGRGGYYEFPSSSRERMKMRHLRGEGGGGRT